METLRNKDASKLRMQNAAPNKHSMLMISGGTGAGKASFILSFTAISGEYVIWVQFGSESLHTEKFWRTFIKALEGWDNYLATHLTQTEVPVTINEIGRFITLLNQTSSRAGKAILAFENVHLLKDGSVKNLVDNIADLCTVGITTLLIAGENIDIGGVPRAKISRLTEQNMQFSKEEIRVYYTALGIVLNPGTLDTIWQLTRGWTEAVYRLGKCLIREEVLTVDDIDNAINFVYQYFQEEYHTSIKPKVHQAIILLSLLDSFTMELAVELASITLEELKDLVQNNRFICYRSATNSYYFHNMYQRFLEGKQIEISKKIRFAFLRKAAHWFEQCGMITESLSCYINCQDFDKIIPILQKISVLALKEGQASHIANLLEKIPQDYMNTHPQHRLYLIFTKFFSGEEELALRMQNRFLIELEHKERSPEEDRVLGELHVSEAFFQAWCDKSSKYVYHMKRARGLLPEGTAFLDSDDQYSLKGGALQFMEMSPGDLLRAKEIVLKSIPDVRQVLPKGGASACYIAAAEVHMYRMEFNEAMEYANMAICEAISTRQWGTVSEGYYILQRIGMAFSEFDDLVYYGQQIQDYTGELNNIPIYSVSHISQFYQHLYFGTYHLFDEWAKINPLIHHPEGNRVNIGRELYVYVLYMVYALKQYYPALTYIENAIHVCRHNGMWFPRLKLIIMKAIIYSILENPSIAAKVLKEAYQMSSPNNILFPFMEFGAGMAGLIQITEPYVTHDDIDLEWRHQVLDAAQQYDRRQKVNTLEYLRRNPHVKLRKLAKLTRQENRVLKYMCMGRSAADIAKMLSVEQATVQIYISRIYVKLEVNKKEEAVQIAIEEGILN